MAFLFPQQTALSLVLDRNLSLLNICHFSGTVLHRPHVKDARQKIAAGLYHVVPAETAAKIEDLEVYVEKLEG